MVKTKYDSDEVLNQILVDAKKYFSDLMTRAHLEFSTEKEFLEQKTETEKQAIDQMKSKIKDSGLCDINSQYLIKLNKHIATTFNEMKESFRLSKQSEDIDFHAAMNKAKACYNEQMEGNLIPRENIPDDLFENMHLTASILAVTSLRLEAPPGKLVTQRQLGILSSYMETKFLDFKWKNQSKIATQTAIGIDLGTTNCCVAVVRNGEVVIIPNNHKQNTTPSIVLLESNGSEHVGEQAKRMSHAYPMNTIYHVKRFMGRRFLDKEVQNDMKLLSYKIIDEQGSPRIQVDGREDTYSPEEIPAKLLKRMKKIAEEYLQYEVISAVITIPAYFNDAQRQATKHAGEIAGLNVLKIINEPTAAAIAYGLHRKDDETKNVLIYDLGGGTFDVSIIEVSKHRLRIKSVGGDTHLGGEDFDERIQQYCFQKFLDQHNIDLSNDPRAIRRTKNQCELSKCDLTHDMNTTIAIECISGEIDMELKLTRTEFEDMNSDLFQKTMESVKNALKDAHLTKNDIDDIVLIDGSTKIPKVQQLLQIYFNGKVLSNLINPDEAVAYGAAVQAAILNVGQCKDMMKYDVFEVTPISLGVRLKDDRMSIIIPKNSPIPTSFTKEYVTASDDQVKVHGEIYEGEDELVMNNHKLGEFILDEIPLAPAGMEKVDITMRINTDGILHVKGVVRSNNNMKEVTINYHGGRLTREQVEQFKIQETTNNPDGTSAA